MDTTLLPSSSRRALAIGIDRPFQRVLAAWLGARSYEVVFATLAAAASVAGRIDLIVCELAEPKGDGTLTLGELARTHPGAPMIAISARFVAGARRDALGRQLGADAALAKPFSRDDLLAALDTIAESRRDDGA